MIARRGLKQRAGAAPPTGPPVTDGLLCWFDCTDAAFLSKQTGSLVPPALGETVVRIDDKAALYTPLLENVTSTIVYQNDASGNPCLVFDGASMLVNHDGLNYFIPDGADYTYFVVARATSNFTAYRCPFGFGSATQGTWDHPTIWIPDSGGADLWVRNRLDGTTRTAAISGSYNDSQKHVVSCLGDNAAGLSVWADKTASGSYSGALASTSSTNFTEFTIGSDQIPPRLNYYWYGPVYDVLWYNRKLTIQEKEQIEDWLLTKHGMPIP